MLALVPAGKPATAAPVSRNRFDFVIFPNDLLMNFAALHFGQTSLPKDRLSSKRNDRDVIITCTRVYPGSGPTGSTKPQHTPNSPPMPLKPFGRPCKIFVTPGSWIIRSSAVGPAA